MRVRLLFFAVLRDITGLDETDIEVPPATKPRDVWESLRERHAALRDYHEPPLTAINENYATADTPLQEGDELAFIPPVAGG